MNGIELSIHIQKFVSAYGLFVSELNNRFPI